MKTPRNSKGLVVRVKAPQREHVIVHTLSLDELIREDHPVRSSHPEALDALMTETDTNEYYAYRQRMKTAEAKEIYKQRSSTAEFPNADCRNRGLRPKKKLTAWELKKRAFS